MYRSLLVEGGFHREREGQLRFGEPYTEWKPVWQAMQQFLASTQLGRRPFEEFISLLRCAPFGLREGPVPVLLCVLLLAHRDAVALYEDGVFVPELRIEVFERLMRIPKAFEIQHYTFSDQDRESFTSVNGVLETLQIQREQSVAASLLEVVKPLVMFVAQLPAYTKNTKRLDPPVAITLREVILKAQDPYKLLFTQLPLVLEVSSLAGEGASVFADLLKDAMLSLQRAYPRLLDEIEGHLREVFDLHGTAEEARTRLQQRAMPLNGYTSDRTLALFVREAGHHDRRDWRETLARVVNGGIPPNQWHDADLGTFQIRLRQLASDFIRLEELVAEQHQTAATQILRIGLLDQGMHERREIVALTPERAGAVNSLAERMVQLLEEDLDQSEEARRVRIAALAQVAAHYLQRNGRTDDE
jgi:hypothetical protein